MAREARNRSRIAAIAGAHPAVGAHGWFLALVLAAELLARVAPYARLRSLCTPTIHEQEPHMSFSPADPASPSATALTGLERDQRSSAALRTQPHLADLPPVLPSPIAVSAGARKQAGSLRTSHRGCVAAAGLSYAGGSRRGGADRALELLTNAVLHGAGSSVAYRSWSPQPGLVHIEIDDGTGDPGAPAHPGCGVGRIRPRPVPRPDARPGAGWRLGLQPSRHHRMVPLTHRRPADRTRAEPAVSNDVIEAPPALPAGTRVIVCGCLPSAESWDSALRGVHKTVARWRWVRSRR